MKRESLSRHSAVTGGLFECRGHLQQELHNDEDDNQ